MSTGVPADVEHAVVRTRLWPIEMIDDRPLTLLRFHFLDGTTKQQNAVRATVLSAKRKEEEASWEQRAKKRTLEDDPPAQSPNPFTFVTWEECANIEFRETSNKQDSQIRITFHPAADGSSGWLTDLGVDADDNKEKQTMILQPLADAYPPHKVHRRSILHEFGHALGLDHEHQSPASRQSDLLMLRKKSLKKATLENSVAMDEELITLRKDLEAMNEEVKDKGGKLSSEKIAAMCQRLESKRKQIKAREAKLKAMAKRFVQDNYLEVIEDDENLWNYTNFDTRSIMSYEIKREWQKQDTKLKIDLVFELSDVDQAIVKLMYPPDLREVDNQLAFRRALETVHAPNSTAGTALAEFDKKHKENPDGDVVLWLTELRNRFAKWTTSDGETFNRNSAWMPLYDGTIGIVPVARGIDPASLRQSGITHFAGEVMNNKLFRSIVKNVVYRTTVQRGIPTKASIPGATHAEATRMIAALSMNDDVARLIREHKVALTGENVTRRAP